MVKILQIRLKKTTKKIKLQRFLSEICQFSSISVQEELTISETFFAILLTEILIDERKEVFSPHKKVSQDLTEKKQDLTKMSKNLMVLTEI